MGISVQLQEEISELLMQLNLDSQEIFAKDYNANVFSEGVDAVLREKEYRELNKGLINSKVELCLYTFYKEIEFKNSKGLRILVYG